MYCILIQRIHYFFPPCCGKYIWFTDVSRWGILFMGSNLSVKWSRELLIVVVSDHIKFQMCITGSAHVFIDVILFLALSSAFNSSLVQLMYSFPWLCLFTSFCSILIPISVCIWEFTDFCTVHQLRIHRIFIFLSLCLWYWIVLSFTSLKILISFILWILYGYIHIVSYLVVLIQNSCKSFTEWSWFTFITFVATLYWQIYWLHIFD
jgi:hypothetical protein